jgi:ribosome-binding factor A
MDRVNNQVLDVLSSTLAKDINLSSFGFVTFTSVDVAPDLRSAKVYYSVLNPTQDFKSINVEVNKRRKAFKKFMGPELSYKSTPDLVFYHDERFVYEEKIGRLIKRTDIVTLKR